MRSASYYLKTFLCFPALLPWRPLFLLWTGLLNILISNIPRNLAPVPQQYYRLARVSFSALSSHESHTSPSPTSSPTSCLLRQFQELSLTNYNPFASSFVHLAQTPEFVVEYYFLRMLLCPLTNLCGMSLGGTTETR